MPLFFGAVNLMLREELCKKCHRIEYHNGGIIYNEEVLEDRKYVYCPSKYTEKGEQSLRKITGKPPSKCPFFLENII